LIDRRAEENGVSEASSPIHENVGFMAYNVLAGGVLAGTYLNGPPTPYDNPSFSSSANERKNPRGRHDESGWGRTLYRYRSGPASEATAMYAQLAKKYDMSLLELSLRWAQGRRPVTTCLLGQTSMKQLDEQLAIFKKGAKERLPDQLLWDIDTVHMRNRLPIFSSTHVGRDWNGEGEIGEAIP
jgi:aryl-alcohol dehydrogenase-like predicted oxidoreductase